MNPPAIAEELRARSRTIALRATDDMYANPFWKERFGMRGRKRAEEDAAYHVEYLIQSLVARDLEIMRGYARWLQSVLTTRGMCTRHLDESFTSIGAAVAVELPLATIVSDHVRAAREALRYATGPGRAVQEAAPALAASVVDALYAAHPAWIERWGARGRALCLDDVGYHLAYVADVLALGRPALFEEYVRFIHGFLIRRGVGGDHLRMTLTLLDETIARGGVLPAEIGRAASDVLARGVQALTSTDTR